jgi:hypothetical protein
MPLAAPVTKAVLACNRFMRTPGLLEMNLRGQYHSLGGLASTSAPRRHPASPRRRDSSRHRVSGLFYDEAMSNAAGRYCTMATYGGSVIKVDASARHRWPRPWPAVSGLRGLLWRFEQRQDESGRREPPAHQCCPTRLVRAQLVAGTGTSAGEMIVRP